MAEEKDADKFEDSKEIVEQPEELKENEVKEKKSEDKVISFKFNPMKLAVAILGISLIISLTFNFLGKGGAGTLTPTGYTVVLPTDQINTKIITYVKAITGSSDVSVKNITEEGGLYKMSLIISGSTYSTYATKDGKLLFPQAFNLDNVPQTQQETQQTITKSDKPKLEFFVMSFCPYGLQAEAGLGPVAKLLGDKTTIEPHFIISVNADNSLQSLHGNSEANEDMRQACIWKYHQNVWWDYVNYINANCNVNSIDTCWKTAATVVSLNTSEIENCVNTEGITLMKAEEALTNQYGVTGSPTIKINGVDYTGGRSAEAYKQAICSAFNTAPAECSTALAGNTTQASGNC